MNNNTEKPAGAPGQRATECSTHHYACDCREARLREVLRGVVIDLCKTTNLTAVQAYIEINEMWIELYGHEILANTKSPCTKEVSVPKWRDGNEQLP